jgi:GT2 family glycosyltransferase
MGTRIKKTSPLISILIINFNGLLHLEKCLSSLKKQIYKNVEIIMVDNASSDKSVSYTKKNFPSIKLIQNPKNLGFAEANNIAYREAHGEYILFLNNDTEVTDDFLVNLYESIHKDTRIGGVQSKLLFMDNPKFLDSVGAFLTYTGILYYYGISKPLVNKYNHRIKIYSAKGACMLFRKKALDDILVNNEIFDKSYFAYFEETDMCHRIWLAGYSIDFIPNSTVFHKMGGTSNLLNNSFIQYHSFKNRINSYIKNLEIKNLFIILPIHLIFCELFAVFSLFKLKPEIFLSIQRAIVFNLLNIKKTLIKRAYIQTHIRKRKDEDIFPYILKKPGVNYYLNLFSGLKNYKDNL